eukprot:CAMPEP_0172674676 /NCGR_PEP_ID=MMETSP1074-20121228/12862_1 /TAXON_ID=2916 /ORGANISM="Ceratium fusus, Strain PA161109" /LENGTH=213 /DNA_ID=CAMNT_0013492099 /DNA_START=599 /DNA_END=1239 /DNA_ORIENTATION=-
MRKLTARARGRSGLERLVLFKLSLEETFCVHVTKLEHVTPAVDVSVPYRHPHWHVPEDVHMSLPTVGPGLERQGSGNQHGPVSGGVSVHNATVDPALPAPAERSRRRNTRNGHGGPHTANEVLYASPMADNHTFKTPAHKLCDNNMQPAIDNAVKPGFLRFSTLRHEPPDTTIFAFPDKVPAMPEHPWQVPVVVVVLVEDRLICLAANLHQHG